MAEKRLVPSKRPKLEPSQNLTGPLTSFDFAALQFALQELGFKGAGSDSVKINGVDFQSCEVNEAACELFIASHKLGKAFPELSNQAIVNKTIQTKSFEVTACDKPV